MPVLVAIAAMIALVWGTVWLWRGSLMAGCLVYLLTACCFGYDFYHFDVGGITLSLDRLIIVLLVGAVAVHWRLGRLQFRPPTAADWIMAGYVGLLMLSVATHDRQFGPDNPEHVVQHLLNGYLIPLALYVVVRQMPLGERDVKHMRWAMLGFGLYLALTGIFEHFGVWALVAPRYIADPELGLHYGRARGPMVHSVSYGIYLVACLACLWIWRPRMERLGQLMVLLATPLFMAAVFFTKTRSVWLGAATAGMLVLLFTLRGRFRVVVLASILGSGVLVGVMNFDAILGLKREGTVADTRQSATMRKSFAYVSWQMFQDKPLMGFGFGQFAQAKREYLTDHATDLQLEQIREYVHHNTFLSVLVDLGLVGFAMFLALYAVWMRDSWQLLRDRAAPPWVHDQGLMFLAMVAIAFWQMLAHEISYSPLDHSLIFFFAAIAVNLWQTRQRELTAGQAAVVRSAAEGSASAPSAQGYAT